MISNNLILHLLFDIDGVMIAYPNGPTVRPQFFSAEPIKALQWLLSQDPNIMIVFTTTMKDNRRDNATLSMMWTSAGLPVDRIAGMTKTPGSLSENREKIVKHYMRGNDILCLPVDDELLFGVRYMKTNAAEGLTLRQAKQILEFAKGRGAHVTNTDIYGFGLSYLKSSDCEL